MNRHESAAPSSSILWPALLAPFARAPWFEYVPLAINVAASMITIGLYRQVAKEGLGIGSWGGQRRSLGGYVMGTGAHGRGARRRRVFMLTIPWKAGRLNAARAQAERGREIRELLEAAIKKLRGGMP